MTATDDVIDEILRTTGSLNGGAAPGADEEATAAASGLAPETVARFVDGGSFVLDAPTEVPAVWGRDDQVAWAEGEALMLVGPAGVGKTTLVGQLVAGRLGLMKDVLGMPVVPGERRVLYLACDRPRQIQRALRRLFGPDDRDALDERLIVWKGPPPNDFGKHPELLAQMVQAADADTVIVDSLKDVAIGLSDDEVGAGVNRARQKVLVDGCEVVELHHQRKGSAGEKPKTLADVYGSTWITAGAGSVVLLWGQPGDLIVEMVHLKQPGAEIGPWKIEHDHGRGLSTVYRGFDALRYLRGQKRGATVMEVARQMYEKDKPTDNDRKKTERALKALVDRQLAYRDESTPGPSRGAGSGVRYFATPDLTVLNGGAA